MESIFQTIKAKGLTTTIRKILLNFKRYHLGTKKTIKRFELIADILENNKAKMTIHVPAILLEYHYGIFKKINDKNIEWNLHGYKHIDHSELSYDECYKQLKTAKEIFEKYGIDPKGFRAPYLKGSKNVVRTLSKLGLLYDSSSSVFVDVIDRNHPKIKTILNYYKTKDKWSLVKSDGIFEIPVILPDDEMLVDRLGYSGKEVGEIWVKVANICKKNNWIFILQLHPDRVDICYDGLQLVLDWANKNKIWLPTLSEVALEGGIKEDYNGAIVITGDLDLISIWDYRRIS